MANAWSAVKDHDEALVPACMLYYSCLAHSSSKWHSASVMSESAYVPKPEHCVGAFHNPATLISFTCFFAAISQSS